MADSQTAFDPAGLVQSDTTPPEERQSPPASGTGKGVQNSTGACDACRLRKVRCLANDSSHSSKCQRCARSNRECVYTTHSKTRRRKRTDTRVKELEEKVRGLSMLLEHGGKGNSIPSLSEEKETDTMVRDDRSSLSTPSDRAGSYAIGDVRPIEVLSPFTYNPGESWHLPLENAAQIWDQTGEDPDSSAIVPDVVDQGILSMETAEKLYDRYLNKLLLQGPVVPLSCTVAELRKEKPILFLAVMAASAGSSDPALNLRLNQEAQQIYAKRISIQGRKSLELLQALCVSVVWTYPPEKTEELKFHQQVQMAATMAMDLGLGKRPKPSLDSASWSPGLNDSIINKAETPHGAISTKPNRSDSGTLDSRRALLACYAFCTSVSMSLRLPNMLRFTSWMAECVEFIKTSPDAAPTDKSFIAWVELQRIVEDCAMSFGLDSDETVSLADESIQLKLKTTEKQLESWRRDALSRGVMGQFQTLEITYHVNQVYLHEIALHPDHDAEEFRPPFSITSKPASQTKITPVYINAILTCVSSSESLLKTFLGMPPENVRSMPTMAYARVVYCAVILMKLSISSTVPSSQLSRILDPQDLKIDYYLTEVIAHMKAVTILEDGKLHVLSGQFLNIILKLKMWFESIKMPQPSNSGQSKAFDPKKEENIIPNLSADDTGLLPGSDSYRLVEDGYDFSKPPSSNGPGFFTDMSRGPSVPSFNTANSQSMQATSWPNQNQQIFNYPEVDSLFPSSNIPFDFPMEVDPSMFTHFMDTELSPNGQSWLAPEGSAMDYTNIPDFNWGNGNGNGPV